MAHRWVTVNKYGTHYTIARTRREAITEFRAHWGRLFGGRTGQLTWRQWCAIGLRCQRVAVGPA